MLSLTRNGLRSAQPIARTLATRGSVASIHSLPDLPYGYDVSGVLKVDWRRVADLSGIFSWNLGA
jgi:hypothetical protein